QAAGGPVQTRPAFRWCTGPTPHGLDWPQRLRRPTTFRSKEDSSMPRVATALEDVLAEVSRLPLHTVVELAAPDGRSVFILGESPVKTREAADLCRQAVEAFSLRGVERLQRDAVVGGELLGGVFERAREALQRLSDGRLAGSSIEVALEMSE